MKTPELDLPSGIETHFSETPQEAAQQLADTVAEFLRGRLHSAERASLAVSGGSTPLPFFQALSRKTLDWGRVDVLLVDERWVDETHEDSNTKLVKENLLQSNAAVAQFLSIKQSGSTPEESLGAAETELTNLMRPLDVLVLGMGNDGHTASLFPDAPELSHAMNVKNRDALAAMTPPSQTHERITLTYALMREARFIALHLKGNDKLETLKRACSRPNDVLEMPVRGFLKSGLRVYWSP
ncbi:6-phosphogluconolactonase [Marinobacter salexigens]|uniref:6-phosphogluconolactonase n=1 Tax=Marinobacter salexigens TaxID=1925763 RepID=A0ABS6ABD7_9GAMM|nr:6-phosphogluconolactonase [Marinobacter salexigens]MBU2875451.1 6-phosphogluconolactonase [Marinobacter salexigens]